MPQYYRQVVYNVKCNGIDMDWHDGPGSAFLSFSSVNESAEFETVERAVDAIKKSIEYARSHGYETTWAICYGAVSIVPVEPELARWKFVLDAAGKLT